jgi:aminoglycoside/choline kinase family phosphotransferase
MSNELPADAARDLNRWLGRPQWASERIAGDASARAYYRIRLPDNSTRVLTWYPREIRADIARFLRAYHAVEASIPVPRVIESSSCAVLQEDVGDLTLTAMLGADPAAAINHYDEAVRLLVALQAAKGPAAGINPAFDVGKFTDELDMTLEFYVKRLAGVGSEERVASLRASFEALAARLVTHPYILCHRDYHGQNIHVNNNTLYVIDYQDVRMGPDTYDVASLLRDRGVWREIGSGTEERILRQWAGYIGDEEAAVRRRYLETLLQRSLKAIGTFARMSVVYGRRHYLGYVGATLQSVALAARELGEWPEIVKYFPFDDSIA